MATRDMDVAAEIIGIRPIYAKLSAFAVSSFTSESLALFGPTFTLAPGNR